MPINLKDYSYPNRQINICFICVQDNKKYFTYRLKQNIQSTLQSSLSPFIALAQFIVFNYPKLLPPGFKYKLPEQVTNKMHDKKNGQNKQQYKFDYHYLLQQPWCDYISNLVVQNKIYKDQQRQTIYLVDVLDKQYCQQLILTNKQIFLCQQISSLQQTSPNISQLLTKQDYPTLLQHIYNLPLITQIKKNKKISVICFGPTISQSNIFNPKVHMPCLAFGLYYQQNYQMSSFKILNNQSPSQEYLLSLDGIILSGSPYSVYDHIKKIDQFMEKLIKCYKINSKIKILGFCFGHQAIGEYFGGKVESMGRRVVGVEPIIIEKALINNYGLDYFNIQSSNNYHNTQQQQQQQLILNQSQCHGDHVSIIPPQFILLGQSPTCSNQSMAHPNKRVLSFQFHIQFLPQYTRQIQQKIQTYNPNAKRGYIYILNSGVQSTQKSLKDALYLRQVTRKFIEGK